MSTSWSHLELADYLLIAEAVLGMPAERIAKLDRIGLADSALHAPRAAFGGVEQYETFEAKAAVLCVRLLKNHPLPDGNKRAAFLSLIEFAQRNGRAWTRSSEDPDETDRIIRAAAAGDIGQAELEDWIATRTSAKPG